MGKYVIESKFENTRCFLEVACENREPYFFINRVDSLTPYTEPDLEQIRKEAWDAARKIAVNADHGGLSAEALREIFAVGTASIARIFDNFSASEAIEKIRQYEQEKEEIKVGDEVNAPFGKAIVVNIDSVAEKIWLVYADGHGGFEYFKDAPRKTGRHFPEIAEVLQKMKES